VPYTTRVPESKTESAHARLIKPLLLLRTEALPEGERWSYKLKLDVTGRWHSRLTDDVGRVRSMSLKNCLALRYELVNPLTCVLLVRCTLGSATQPCTDPGSPLVNSYIVCRP
jgi:hypothetical protein